MGSALSGAVGGVELAAIEARLRERLALVACLGSGAVPVSRVEHDHRAVTAPTRAGGTLFCCLTGSHRDGHELAPEAARAGAVAFLCERDLGDAAVGRPQIVVAEGMGRSAMAHAACLVAGDPAERLTTVGITGTNGKTTTAHLAGSILAAAGYEATVLGTLSGTRTTPESPELQRRLAAAASTGEGRPGAVALEVTSHGLVQHRVDGYVHDVAVFTNLSQDHLDFHGTMEDYFAAKKLLFTPEHSRRGVVNADDEHGRRLLAEASVPVDAFRLGDAEALEVRPDGSRFLLRGEEVQLALVGPLNVANALAAAAGARALGIDDATIAAGLSASSPVPGRFEAIRTALGFSVVVDYAHTPAGIEQACATLRPLVAGTGRLVVVFGAGGDRDREKRPQMGRAAADGADVVVVTTDNPRHEDPEAILHQVAGGAGAARELHLEVDRRRAIRLALSLARRGDVVLLAGKGHETTQQVGDEYVPFDDRAVAAEEAEALVSAR